MSVPEPDGSGTLNLPSTATAGDVALACMAELVGELGRRGVSDACLSPGSRSTPLVLALSRNGGFRLHVHLDERSSAFFGLGLALRQGRPVAVVCTSGTAVANWLPAVVEASMSRVPLLLLSADRPPELRGTGANQTIDQVGIFGGFVRWFADAPVPEPGPGADERWRLVAADLVRRALLPVPGPVHLNLPFREPLVPSGRPVALGDLPPPRNHPPIAAAGGTAAPVNGRDAEEVAELVAGTDRGVILAGAGCGDGEAIRRLAVAAGWPLIAEPASGARTGAPALAAGVPLLGAAGFASANRPEVVLQLGATPTSRACLALARLGRRFVVVTPPGAAADPAGLASLTVHGDPAALAMSVAGRLSERRESAWMRSWEEADRRAADAITEWMHGLGDELFEGRVARDLAARLPDGATLFAGSSMPIRDLDAWMLPRSGLRIAANRGASGIDGSVSTVLGLAAAAAAEPRPAGHPPFHITAAGGQGVAISGAERRITTTFALLGDLTLLHDAGALLWGGRGGQDVVMVVVNNDGGGVFALLEQARLPEHEALFATPHRLDIGALVRASGAGHRTVSRTGDLLSAVAEAASVGGVQVVEVRTDRARQAELRRSLSAAVERSLTGLRG
ncbi:MAG TPA: 2-succinyl-5-enolpyruvyl-6-hydroxy-3-cyclohexene-1-carboxylic-acid synthase [Candidatus Binatia bacterium]|nr:2-succinyl-5-enolpyruvyl-6-hydroxy-3-cyclohexene-1-carboxylic-acid synthase [Candidatus Binatia bacterium]